MNIELGVSSFMKLWHCFYVHYVMTLPCLDYVSSLMDEWVWNIGEMIWGVKTVVILSSANFL